MVLQEPGWPGRHLSQVDEVLHRRADRCCPPGEVEEDEVVREVQLVSGVDVLHDPAQVHQVDLADEHPVVILVDDGPDPAQPIVDGGPVLVVAQARLVVTKFRILGDLVDDVDAEAVSAPVEPEAQDVVHRRLHFRVVPVEVGLMWRERVQVVLPGRLVERPRGADRGEGRLPVVRRPAVGRGIAPHVPVTLGAVRAAGRLNEPRVLVGGVVRHPVDDDLDVAMVRGGEQIVEVLKGPEDRIDVGVVRDVVAEVGHRRSVEWRKPDGGHAERRIRAVVQVIEVLQDAGQVAHSIPVGIGETARVDLVDHSLLPPGDRLRARRGIRGWADSGRFHASFPPSGAGGSSGSRSPPRPALRGPRRCRSRSPQGS